MRRRSRRFSRQAADVSAVVFLHDGSVTVEAGGGAKTVNLLVPQSSLEGIMDLHRGGEKLAMPGTGETLLNDALAEALGVSVGDTVTLRDSDMNTLTVTVSGIFDNYVSNYAIVSPETCREQWGSVPPVKTAFIRVADNSERRHPRRLGPDPESGECLGGISKSGHPPAGGDHDVGAGLRRVDGDGVRRGAGLYCAV